MTAERGRRSRTVPSPGVGEEAQPVGGGECREHQPRRGDVLAEARLGFETWRLYRVVCARCGKDMGNETERR